MKCNIVKELLPNYVDHLVSEETGADIKGHLEECESCRRIYKQLLPADSGDALLENKEIDMLKKLREKILRKHIIIAVSTFVVLAGFFFFAGYYEMPLPFDANRMFIEQVQAVVEPVEHSSGEFEFMLDTLDDLDFESTKEVLSGEREILDLVRFAYKGINGVSYNARGKTIERNGEDIRVVYFCCYKTLWDSLFLGDWAGYSESGYSFHTMYDYESYSDGTFEPQKMEVYYLPMRNIHEIESLSDEEFDKLRENAWLIWSGMSQ